jgi:magnesium chelatase family protein
VDLQIELGPVRFRDWAEEAEKEEPSRAVADRVRAARERQRRRLGPGRTNASMSARETRSLVRFSAPERAFLEEASARLGLSARGLDRLVRAARTAADLAGAERVERPHLAEALQFRALDRRLSAA